MGSIRFQVIHGSLIGVHVGLREIPDEWCCKSVSRSFRKVRGVYEDLKQINDPQLFTLVVSITHTNETVSIPIHSSIRSPFLPASSNLNSG